MSFFDVVKLWGLLFAVILVVPHIVYARTHKVSTADYSNRAMVYIARTGRFFSAFLMAFNIGIAEFGFASTQHFVAYLIANTALLVAYFIVYALYFKRQTNWKSMALAIIPSCLFLTDGILLRHYLLVSFAIIFALAHICITRKDSCSVQHNE